MTRIVALALLAACSGGGAAVGEACQTGDCAEGLHCHIESGDEGTCMDHGGGSDHSDHTDESDDTDA